MYFISLDTKQAGAIETGCVAALAFDKAVHVWAMHEAIGIESNNPETGNCAGISRPAGFG